jgi:hypothetical protein
MKTVSEKLFSDYKQYIKLQGNNTDISLYWLWGDEYEYEFQSFIKENNIEDKNIISELYKMYKKTWLNDLWDFI